MDAPQRGFIAGLAYNIALAVATACAVGPFLLVPIPAILPYPLLLIPLIAGVMLSRAHFASNHERRTILWLAATAAALSFATTLIMIVLPPFPLFHVPVPNLTGRLLHLEGGDGYRLGVYELWCEVWLVLALLCSGLRFAISRVVPGARHSTGR
jgi:hypothetical protein